MNSSLIWRHHLLRFESPAWCQKERRRTANALRHLGLDDGPTRSCPRAGYCRSGLCATCIRRLRINLLDFLSDAGLHDLRWHFVTIRVQGWKVPAGDHTPFGRLRDQPCIKNFLTKLRRMRIPNLLVFGSIETIYVTVNNVPTPKPFHLHLMISGATEEEIAAAIAATIEVDSDDVSPVDIEPVPPTDDDFFQAASYVFKQPLWKKSKASPDDRGRRQTLKAGERRELISNLGVHGWIGRLILLGIRCDNGVFRLLPNLSATAAGAKSFKSRKSPCRQSGQRPGRPRS